MDFPDLALAWATVDVGELMNSPPPYSTYSQGSHTVFGMGEDSFTPCPSTCHSKNQMARGDMRPVARLMKPPWYESSP